MQVDEGQLVSFLIDSGLMTRTQLSLLAPTEEKSLYQILSEQNVIAEDELRRAAAHATGTTFVILTKDDISPTALFHIPEPIARSHNMLAYATQGNVLEVALLDLDDLAYLEPLNLSYRIRPRLTTRASIRQGLIYYQKLLKEKFAGLLKQGEHVVDALVHHALLSSAHGVHIDLHTTALVRYRIGEALREAMQLPIHIGAQLSEQLKALAKLLPTSSTVQEGRFRFDKEGERHTVSVTALPTATGERLVLRLAKESQGSAGFSLASLGLHGKALEQVHSFVRAKSGLVMIVGPKEGGKTTTLYTLLDQLDHTQLAIATVEEKIEHHFGYIAQTQTKSEIGLSTLAGLRAVLKQEPDVVAVGDLRDADTAQLALHAANAGTLVFLCIEGNTAGDAIESLLTAGVSPTMLATTLKGVIAVDALRRVCPYDHEEYSLSRAEGAPLEGSSASGGAGADFGKVLASLKDEKIVDIDTQWKSLLFAHAVSCSQCREGYIGYVGVQEVLPISSVIKEMILRGADAPAIEAHACEEGMLTVVEDALTKAAQNLTSIEEVYKLVNKGV
jgi:type IV pilus assembly protein PilB